jgi:transposase
VVWSESVFCGKARSLYRFFETSGFYYDHDVRLIVVESDALDKKKEKTFLKKRVEEAEFLQKEKEQWACRPFHCREDAEKALDSLIGSLCPAFHRVYASIEETERTKVKRCCPKKGTEPEKETVYTIHLDIESDKEAWGKEKCHAFRFVLVTTVPIEWQDKTMDGKEILALYKSQVNVEMNFSFLKNPFFTDEIYVKKPERVLVLGYLFLLELVVYRIFQRRVRQVITNERPLKGTRNRKLTKLTGQAIF